MANCREVEEIMSLVLDERASRDESRILQVHLDTCDSCSMIWSAMQHANDVLVHALLIPPPAGFVEKVMEGIQRRERVRASRIYPILLAAGLLLTLSGVFLGISLAIGNVNPGQAALWNLPALFIGNLIRTTEALARGCAVPLRMMGPEVIAMILAGLLVLVTSSTSLWALALSRLRSQTAGA